MEVALPVRALVRLLIVLGCLAAVVGCGRGDDEHQARGDDVVLTPEAAAKARAVAGAERSARRSRARAVKLEGAGAAREGSPGVAGDAPSPGAPSDAQVRAELRQAREALADFRKHLDTTAFLATGPRARVLRDGTAVAPDDAPDVVKRVILAANEIARFPYKWGGGHGAWRDNGYDCSGSVSFALAGAGLLNRPLTSGQFTGLGDPGPGEWITIYANEGHVFMLVAGLRFDTSGQGRAGTRWQDAGRPAGGFAVRHLAGL